jgi:general secretion pathway protein D
MRRSNNVSSVTATAVLLAYLTGCATPHRERAAVERIPAPAPAPTVTVQTVPVVPPPPPTSVGPRAATRPEPPAPVATPPSPPPPPPTAPPVSPAQRGKFIVLNFDNADIETVIHAASEIVGFNYVIGPGVGGKKITVQTSGRIPHEEVFGVLLAILEVHGVTAVKAGNLYKIVPVEGARERAVPTIIGATPDPARTTDEIITQIVPVRYSSVNDLGTLLRPLISARGTLIANRETNVLIITDSASNIRRLLDIIRLVDVAVTLDELQIIQLNYADATEMAALLNQVFASGRVRAPGTAAAPAAPGAPGAPRPGPAGETGGAERPPLIVADRRANLLIVQARKTEVELIRRLLAEVDINVTGGRRVFIYYAENAKSKDLAATLNAIYGGTETVPTAGPSTPAPARRAGEPVPPPPPPPPTTGPGGPIGGIGTANVGIAQGVFRFIADEVTNAVIVTALPRDWTDLENTIKQLDRMPRQVLIEVLVAEITLNDDTKLGVDWALRHGDLRFANQSIGTGDSPQVVAPSPFNIPIVMGLPGAGLTAFAFQADKFFAMLNALAAENRVNVISSPHIMTSENKKAVINVSESIPIVTSQQTGTLTTPATTGGTTSTTATTGSLNQTVEYRDAGVVLTVTPRIGERGTVALDVKQEVNDVGAPEAPTGSRRINKREAETSVVLVNNQTLVLGGLITDRRSFEKRGVPILNKIPFLGYFFGFEDRASNKRELLILITPRVVGTTLDASRITDEMRHATPDLDRAIQSAPRAPISNWPPPTTPNPIPVPVPLPPTSSSAPLPPPPPAETPLTPPAELPPPPSR